MGKWRWLGQSELHIFVMFSFWRVWYILFPLFFSLYPAWTLNHRPSIPLGILHRYLGFVHRYTGYLYLALYSHGRESGTPIVKRCCDFSVCMQWMVPLSDFQGSCLCSVRKGERSGEIVYTACSLLSALWLGVLGSWRILCEGNATIPVPRRTW